jgi:hypothetical protein
VAIQSAEEPVVWIRLIIGKPSIFFINTTTCVGLEFSLEFRNIDAEMKTAKNSTAYRAILIVSFKSIYLSFLWILILRNKVRSNRMDYFCKWASDK